MHSALKSTSASTKLLLHSEMIRIFSFVKKKRLSFLRGYFFEIFIAGYDSSYRFRMFLTPEIIYIYFDSVSNESINRRFITHTYLYIVNIEICIWRRKKKNVLFILILHSSLVRPKFQVIQNNFRCSTNFRHRVTAPVAEI